jgi:pimeloyl-ACP methyl ester carboxylesterase
MHALPHRTQVYAIDLLGFGASDKPVLQYTIELWAQLIVDFLAEFCGGAPAVVVGNSIGSLSCLAAAAQAAPGQLAGLVLLNSAGAMNNKVRARACVRPRV